MRGAGVCWSCLIALAAGWGQGSRAATSEDDEAQDSRAKAKWNMWPGYRSRVNKSAQQAMVQKLHVVTISRERAAATVNPPTITKAAVLGKRNFGSTRWNKLPEGILGRKRDATVCPADYQLCPPSLNGGCCPSNLICDTSSCLPNTASSAAGTVCGRASYIPCGLEAGGGCCPPHYICPTDLAGGCKPSSGVSSTALFRTSAGTIYASCPSYLGGLWCATSLGCGDSGLCYTTTPIPYTLPVTFTTTDISGHTTTSITTITSSRIIGAPTSTPTDSGAIVAVYFPPSSTSAVPKIPASSTPSSSGVSKPMIGGIIGGAGFFLLLILLVAFCIMRRLRRTIKVTEEASRSRSRTNTTSNSIARPPRPDIDAMSIDPLIMSPTSGASAYWRRPSESERGLHSSLHEVDAPHIPQSSPDSQSTFGAPSTETKTLVFNSRTNAYEYQSLHAAAMTESHYSSRNPSLDSTPTFQNLPPAPQDARGYFDLIREGTPPSPHRPNHGRQWSNSSTHSDGISSGLGSPPLQARSELEGDSEPVSPTSPTTERRTSAFGKVLMGLGMGRARRSSVEVSTPPDMKERRGSKEKKDVGQVLTGGPVRDRMHRIALGHIEEAGESRIDIGGADMGMVKGHTRVTSETVLMDGDGR